VWKDVLPRDRQPQGEDESLDALRNMQARMQADWTAIDPNGPAAGGILEMMLAKKIGFDPTLSIQRIGDGLRARLSLEQFAVAQDSYKRMSEFVNRAYRMGIRILAGTDNGNLFDEMEAYSAAGIPNAEVLRAATINGAVWLGQQTEFGTIEPGKRADIVVVNGDPLREMKDIRKIDVVIKDGQVVYEQ
jgi:imidazolonepropionase-like amidohydrolase